MSVALNYTKLKVTRFALVAALASFAHIVFAVPQANAKPKVSTSYKSYSVPGKSAQQLFAHMSRYGPHANGAPALATTAANFSHGAKLRRGKGCKLTSYQVSMKFVITLPKARNKSAMPPKLRKRWGQFAAHAKWHEQQHRKIWIRCARKIEKRVRALRPQRSCETAWAKARDIASQELERCDVKHAAFDRKESKRASKLPLIKQALRAPAPSKTRRTASNRSRKQSLQDRLDER
ncbi:MAG: DUF922 domain-containing protein [Hyphomicrobiales bacterium]